MKVKILTGCRASGEHCKPGATKDLSKDDALILISLGKAEIDSSEDSTDEDLVEAKKRGRALTAKKKPTKPKGAK